MDGVKLWPLLRDILLTGVGLAVIASQVFSAHPSGLLLGTGLVLTVPSQAEHLKALLPGGGGQPSSVQPEQATLPSSSSSQPGPSGGS